MKRALFVLLFLLLPFAHAGIEEDVQVMRQRIDRERSPITEENLFVKGERISLIERAAFAYARRRFPDIAKIPVQGAHEPLPENVSVLFLLGGPRQNSQAEALLASATGLEDRRLTTGRFLVFNASGRRVMLFSDPAGFGNLAKKTDRSPLSKFLPIELVPAAAILLGVGLVWLWHFLFGLLVKIGRFKAADLIIGKVKKKDLKERFLGFTVRGVRIKLREIIAVLIAATVFAVSLGYMYLDPSVPAWKLFGLTVLVNMVIYSIRHAFRVIFDVVHGHHTEYVSWWWGAAFTAVTAWLGQTFGLAGYIVAEKEASHDAHVPYLINLATFLAGVGFFVWNLLAPTLFTQMAMLLSLAIAFLQMLPLSPFSGKRIIAWKWWLWLITFLPLTALYLLTSYL